MDGDDLTPQEKLEVRQLRLMTPEQREVWRSEMLGPRRPDGLCDVLDPEEHARRNYLLFKAEYGDNALP